MQVSTHEDHTFMDPAFPILFHLDTCFPYLPVTSSVHWHENIEVLYFIEGEGIVYSGTAEFPARVGDIVVINPNVLHGIESITEQCRYYCLIVDRSLYEEFGIPVSNMMFKEIVRDSAAQGYYDKIIREWTDRGTFYKPAVKLAALQLLLHLSRYHVDSTNGTGRIQNKQLTMVKDAISYIRLHFREELTIDDICEAIGFSKYYFCRVFKEVTRRTPVDYVNFIRCNYAKNLILSGRYNVSESAEMSGFKNLSYFSKTYKKYMGTLPSQKGGDGKPANAK